jgi:hypothetical protein
LHPSFIFPEGCAAMQAMFRGLDMIEPGGDWWHLFCRALAGPLSQQHLFLYRDVEMSDRTCGPRTMRVVAAFFPAAQGMGYIFSRFTVTEVFLSLQQVQHLDLGCW